MRSSRVPLFLLTATLLTSVAAVVAPAPSATATVASRPTENVYTAPEATPVCRDGICVHYAQDGTNDVPTEDDGGGGTWPGVADNGVPDLVDLISTSLLPQAATTFADAGYRAPVGDGALGGGTDQVDFYVAELAEVDGGASCVRETPDSTTTTAGYCLIDNDYSAAEYGTRLSPVQNLELDVLHQYFYLVQWAYTAANDLFGDAAASWVEDEIYTSYNRNRAYLPYGPLGQPQASLYELTTPYDGDGRWIFFRYLSERFPRAQAGLPVIIRRIWEFLGARRYSVQGVALALRELRTDLPLQFSYFTAWNRQPRTYYSEGASYRPAPLRLSYRIGASASRTTTFDLDHLSAKHFRYTPSMSGAWTLRVRVNMSSIAAGGSAIVTVKPRGKAPYLRKMALNAAGDGVLAVPFGSRVDWIELDAINASARFARCGSLGSNTDATCQGVAVDDGLKQGVVVRAVRG